MKSFALAFLLIVAGASAYPQFDETRESRLVTGNIIKAIQEVSKQIQEAGLDPLIIEHASAKYVLIPLLVHAEGIISELEFTGLSNIAINRMDYTVTLSRLRFDVSLPEVRLSVGKIGGSVKLFGAEAEGSYSGVVAVNQLRVSGEVRVNIGIISGISIRSLSVSFSLGGIKADVALNLLGHDLSDRLNVLLNDKIPNTLNEHQREINDLIESIVWQVIDRVL